MATQQPMTSRDAVTILRAAKKLLSNPERWGQGHLWSTDDDGDWCFCADGALWNAAIRSDGFSDLTASGASLHLSLAARARGFETASKFNDASGRKHAEVLALFDDAIARAQEAAKP